MLGEFQSYASANSFSIRTIKASAVILGDNNRFWVVTFATMERLLKSGYELAA